MPDKLKLCPFCGQEPIMIGWVIKCQCGAEVRCIDAQHTIERWNGPRFVTRGHALRMVTGIMERAEANRSEIAEQEYQRDKKLSDIPSIEDFQDLVHRVEILEKKIADKF